MSESELLAQLARLLDPIRAEQTRQGQMLDDLDREVIRGNGRPSHRERLALLEARQGPTPLEAAALGVAGLVESAWHATPAPLRWLVAAAAVALGLRVAGVTPAELGQWLGLIDNLSIGD